MSFLSKLFGLFMHSPPRVSVQTESYIKKDWEQIEIMLKGGQPSQLKQALIMADKSVDNALRDLVIGNTMGERLKAAKDLYPDWAVYDKVWKAHKIRNSMIHESGYEPPHYVLKEAIENLRKGLKVIGVYV